MRKTILRRLEALEKEHHFHEQKRLSSVDVARIYIWEIVLAYYLGGLKSDEKDPLSAHSRALKYESCRDHYEAVCTKGEEMERYHDAYRRLFANVGLDLDSALPSVLFDALVTMVDQLPDQWLNWLRSNLQERCIDAEIAARSGLPSSFYGNYFFTFSERNQAVVEADESVCDSGVGRLTRREEERPMWKPEDGLAADRSGLRYLSHSDWRQMGPWYPPPVKTVAVSARSRMRGVLKRH